MYKFTCHHFGRQSFTEFHGKRINQINKQLPHNYYCFVVVNATLSKNKIETKQQQKKTICKQQTKIHGSRISGKLTTAIIPVCEWNERKFFFLHTQIKQKRKSNKQKFQNDERDATRRCVAPMQNVKNFSWIFFLFHVVLFFSVYKITAKCTCTHTANIVS